MGGRSVGAGAEPRVSRWPSVALTLLLWLSFVRPTDPAANADLDPSWGAVQAFILRGGAQCGVDTVFTFGPLGWFANPTYVAELFGVHVAWEIVFKLIAASVVATVLVQRRLGRLDFALAYAAALCAGAGPDGFAFVVLFANAAWVSARLERRLAWSILGMVPSVALALVKFPFFVVFGAATVALACVAWRTDRRRAIAFVAGVFALFVAGWSAAGQSPANIPAWIATSWTMASGYGAALGTESPRLVLALALLVLATSAFALRSAWRGSRGFDGTVIVVLFAFTAWIAFKNGFVRSQYKPLAVFDFAAVALFALPLEGFELSRAARTLRRAACVAALIGHVLVAGATWNAPFAPVVQIADRIGASVVFLARTGAVRAELELDLEAKRVEYALPKIRARVGRDAIDLLGFSQGVAFLNDLEYRPRPVFQGYAAYTPALQDLNRRFFESERAPQWVLFTFRSLDDHFPPIEDAAAFAAISRGYRFELEERGWLLLKRVEPAARTADVGSFVVADSARLGERIDLESLIPKGAGTPRVLTLALDVRHTLAGALGTALVKSPPLALEVEDARGRRRTWRIAPGYVESGFVISPLLDTPERCRGWFHGDMELATRSVRVLAAGEDRFAFDDVFRFELRRADNLAPPEEPGYAARRLATVVRPAPAAIETRDGFEIVAFRAETDVLVVGTPSSVRFDLEAGRFDVTAWCGLHPRLECPNANGAALFTLVVRDASGNERELERRVVEPGGGFSVKRLEAVLELERPGAVFLRTARAQPDGQDAVNAFWAMASIERKP